MIYKRITATISLAGFLFVVQPSISQDSSSSNTKPPMTEVKKLFEPRVYADSDGKKLNYRLMKPVDFEVNQKYPLLVFLHGAGERGDDNEAQLKHCMADLVRLRERFPCYVLAPQCPTGEKWVDVDWRNPKTTQPDQASEAMRLTMELLERMVEESAVDTRRVYIAGLSMGGYGTWDAITRYPDRFAAAVPICGGGDADVMKNCKDLPIWCFHGDEDNAVPVQQSRKLIERLNDLGSAVKYTEYPGVGHDSWTETFANDEMHAWLFEQRRSVSE